MLIWGPKMLKFWDPKVPFFGGTLFSHDTGTMDGIPGG